MSQENKTFHEAIPYYNITSPCSLVYRKDSPLYPVNPHTHNATEVYFTLSDLPDVLLDDTVSMVPAGSLIIIPPFCVHQLYHKANIVYERYVLSIHSEWLQNIFFQNKSAFHYFNSGEKPTLLPLRGNELAQMKALFDTALSVDFGKNVNSVFRLFELLSQIDQSVSCDIAKEDIQPLSITTSQNYVNKMIAYINEHLSENLTLMDLSKHFSLNVDYLSRLFKEHTHTSIGHYIALQRIAKAQLMLKDGHSITQIQEELGYSNYAHFAKTFKKLTGTTPGQYRKI